MLKSALLRALLLLGIAVNVGFLLINLAPERPHLATRRRVKVIVRASAQVAKWIKENELREFGNDHDLDFELVALPSFEQVVARLKREAKEPSGVLLAALDDEHADEARQDGLVRAVEDVATPEEIAAIAAEFLPDLVDRAHGPDRKLWFLPKRASLDVTAYLRPAIEDAFLNWEKDRPAIEAALKEANGRGLPKGYELEKSPSQWDDFDLFVASWYWAHHPAPWAASRLNGEALAGLAPRFAHRTGTSDEAVQDLIGSFYRHGLRGRDLGKVDEPAVIDALQWEALFQRHGLIAQECASPEGCDADSVAGLVRSRRVAWATVSQEDSLWIHGGARKDAAWGMDGPSDLGWTLRPAGVSVEVTAEGLPKRTGRTHSFLSAFFWALPIKGADPKLAVLLARFLTQRGLQQREAEALGMLPIRQDIREQYPILFRLDWMQQLLDASYRQIYRGSSRVPDDLLEKSYDELYPHLLADILGDQPRNAPVTYGAVREAAVRAAQTFRPEVSRAE